MITSINSGKYAELNLYVSDLGQATPSISSGLICKFEIILAPTEPLSTQHLSEKTMLLLLRLHGSSRFGPHLTVLHFRDDCSGLSNHWPLLRSHGVPHHPNNGLDTFSISLSFSRPLVHLSALSPSLSSSPSLPPPLSPFLFFSVTDFTEDYSNLMMLCKRKAMLRHEMIRAKWMSGDILGV